VASDARISGSGEFIDQLLKEAAKREKEALRLTRKVVNLPALGKRLSVRGGVSESAVRSGGRTRGVELPEVRKRLRAL
jgi:hypothetical protein